MFIVPIVPEEDYRYFHERLKLFYKSFFVYVRENKDADQLPGNCAADQHPFFLLQRYYNVSIF